MMDGFGGSQSVRWERPNVLVGLLLLALAVLHIGLQLSVPFRTFASEFLAMDVHGFLRKWRVWQPITAVFLSGSTSRLVLSAALLWVLGVPLANAWRKAEFLAYFLVCGAGSFLAFWGWHALGGAASRASGVQGALFGVVAGYGTVFAERRVLVFFLFAVRAKVVAILCFVLLLIVLAAGQGSTTGAFLGLSGGCLGFVLLKAIWYIQRHTRANGSQNSGVADRIRSLQIMENDEL